MARRESHFETLAGGSKWRNSTTSPSVELARRGFTLIELLVVIAIIGILAAMLFPVFAKARESARKIQCLSNVKNIAMAVQIYLAEWDRYWPDEVNPSTVEYFNGAPGGGDRVTLPDVCRYATMANPYLRPAVMLEGYIENREVWQCPSAAMMQGARFIVPMGRNGDWVQNYKDYQGLWGEESGCCSQQDVTPGPCRKAWPPGWGGDVTDSFVQDRLANVLGGPSVGPQGQGVFVQAVGTNAACESLNPSRINDPAWFVVVGDVGKQTDFWDMTGIAFPDYCGMSFCGYQSGRPQCCNADWVNCEFTQACGLDWSLYEAFLTDPARRKQYTRHLGGSNVGFADGHAKWFLAEALLNQSQSLLTPADQADFEGVCACWGRP